MLWNTTTTSTDLAPSATFCTQSDPLTAGRSASDRAGAGDVADLAALVGGGRSTSDEPRTSAIGSCGRAHGDLGAGAGGSDD